MEPCAQDYCDRGDSLGRCVWCSVVHVVMRTITLIILHCSATREGQSFGFEDCRRDHIRHRGFRDIGYHYYITRDGTVYRGRPLEQVGAHCRNHNRHSIGICYEGGLDAEGRAKDTRTEAQKVSLSALVGELKERFPQALVVGHRELDPGKECPCFEVNKLRKCLEFYKNDLSLQKVKTCKT